MTITIRLAVRDWDYFTPLALGDIKPKHFTLMIDRVEALPQNLANSPHYDARVSPALHFDHRRQPIECVIAARGNVSV